MSGKSHLYSDILEAAVRESPISLRPAWTTWQLLGWPGLCNQTLSPKKFQKDSVGKSTFHCVWQPEFSPQNPHGGRREQPPILRGFQNQRPRCYRTKMFLPHLFLHAEFLMGSEPVSQANTRHQCMYPFWDAGQSSKHSKSLKKVSVRPFDCYCGGALEKPN
jgi:hypothetical protein